MLNIGSTITYRGRLHVVVGFTPMGVTPRVLELEDAETGRVRSVESDDRDLVIAVTDVPPLADGRDEPVP